MTLLSPPANDEIEITLLGRGFGECCVLHVDQQQWIIVDSYFYEKPLYDQATRQELRTPIAQWYLDRMEVPIENVKTIVLTHFHADHYVGLPQLYDYYTNSRLVVTGALKSEIFRQIFSIKSEPEFLEGLPGTMKRAQNRKIGEFAGELDYWSIGQSTTYGANVRLSALSPTRRAMQTTNEEIAALIDHADEEALRSKLADENLCSVVLHLNAYGVCALLCADLPAKPVHYGWQAVLDERAHADLAKAELVKVPHHGSQNADHLPMWEKLVVENPRMTVAPFWKSHLPRQSDWERLCARGNLWQTAPSSRWINDEFGNAIKRPAETGIIQARCQVGKSDWRIELEGQAFHVNFCRESMTTAGTHESEEVGLCLSGGGWRAMFSGGSIAAPKLPNGLGENRYTSRIPRKNGKRWCGT